MVAATVLAIGLAALGQAVVVTGRAALAARDTTTASTLAASKLEELRALAWVVDPVGGEVSDRTTDTAVTPHEARGGTGLAVSPPDALERDTPGYVDYVDARGGHVPSGARGPAGAAFVRRWHIAPLAGRPADALVIQVRVVPLTGDALRPSPRPARAGEAWAATVRMRRAR
jgi:hypothetical protein